MFKRTKVCMGVLAAIGGSLVLTSLPASAQQAERIEITGSRIKRVDAEGALPVTTISREQLDSSGATTVAEFMRTVTFASTGNFRPQSGSSAQSFAGVNLRGLGEGRTLVLLDGQRVPVAPMLGEGGDLNSIPMAMIERVEILTDGASAVYGSDAVAGVVNFITRKDFEGVELMAGYSNPVTDGGNRREASASIGYQGEKGRLLAGFGSTKRGMVYTSQRPWGQTLGVSAYGNNYYTVADRAGFDEGIYTSKLTAVPNGCNAPNFWITSTGTCSFNFNAVAADEAEVENTSMFLRGDYQLNPDWSVYVNGSVSRVESFGRYAPTPAQVFISKASPNNPTGGVSDVALLHRFAAAGNRDNFTDNNTYDMAVGTRGRLFDKVDVELGLRTTQSQYYELGRNYIVRPLAEQYLESGEYNILDPYGNDPDILNSIKATISRDAETKTKQVFGSAQFDMFKLAGGTAATVVGFEFRKETYSDQYDSLQEAGVIEGSAGNSSAGDRNVKALYAEMLFPITKTFETTLAARYERYSDYGSDFSPKIGAKWKLLPNLSVRGSYARGFRAPTLSVLNQKTTFSAESVVDPATCIAFGGTPEDCVDSDVQVNTYDQANATLDSEKSKQFGFGVVWDATSNLSLKADYWSVKITDAITQIGAQDIIDRSNGTDPRPIPAGLSIVRNPDGSISRINTGWANEGDIKTDGVDLNGQWSLGMGSYGKMRFDYTYSRTLSFEEGGFDFAGSIGQPKHRAVFAHNWSLGAFGVSWNINYIGKNARQPNSDDAREVGAYTTHDIQLDWSTPIKGSTFVVGAVNAFDKQPSLVRFDNRQFNFNLYDSYGRTWYARYKQAF
ncbi:TonB-dependent receptor [Rubrivivax gelatinosus]|nr:TonB-dependent receptor [Rubrivivax gelatinosus]